LAVDRDKYDIIQVIVSKDITPKLKKLANKNRRKISPFVVELIIKAIEEDEKSFPEK
jgi:mRNA-degrading endonuclease RelE of RelBE toxin-antitoxin system